MAWQQTLTHALKKGGVMLQESEGFEGVNMINLLHVQYVNIADHLCKTFSFHVRWMNLYSDFKR